MGTRMVFSYANLFMGKLEHDFMQTQPLIPLLWVRFLDDKMMLWTHGQTSLNIPRATKPIPCCPILTRITYLDEDITLDNNTFTTSVHIKFPISLPLMVLVRAYLKCP